MKISKKFIFVTSLIFTLSLSGYSIPTKAATNAKAITAAEGKDKFLQYQKDWGKNIQKQNLELREEVELRLKEYKKNNKNKTQKDVVKEILPKLSNQNFNYNKDTGEIKLINSTGPISLTATTSTLGTMGDVLVTLSSNSSSGLYGHAGIVSYYSNSWTVESFAQGFSPQDPDNWGVMWQINDWKNRYSKVAGYWVKNASSQNYVDASKYAEAQIGKTYNFDFNDKYTTTAFYCSQLIWRAWYNRGYDLDSNGGSTVTPGNLSASTKLTAYYKVGM